MGGVALQTVMPVHFDLMNLKSGKKALKCSALRLGTMSSAKVVFAPTNLLNLSGVWRWGFGGDTGAPRFFWCKIVLTMQF